MILLIVYCVFLYLFGFYALHQTLQETGELSVMDIIMVTCAPVTMFTVMVTHLLSHIVDLDMVVYRQGGREM
jgi:arginine exporter protein ArgO